MALTPKQATFVREYLIDLNGAAAAVRAGYSAKTAKEQATRLLTNVHVAAAVAEAQAARAERTEVTQDRVLKELARIGFADVRKLFGEDGLQSPAEMDDDTAAAVSSVEVVVRRTPGDEKRVEHVHKIKLNDKLGALTQIGRHLGMFVDRKELTGKDGEPLQVVINGSGGDADL